MTSFPKASVPFKKPRVERIKLFCKCRFPDNGEEKMIQCVSCKQWYHQSCEYIT